MAILVFPFNKLMPYFGTAHENIQLCVLVNNDQLKQASRIGKITTVATKYTPWKSKCLVQALTAKILLAYYNIPYVIYIGMKRSEQSEGLKAHAWLSVGPWVVTGVEGHQKFTVASSFVSPLVLDSSND